MKFFIFLFFLISYLYSNSQITINTMANLPFSENYKIHEQKLKNKFDKLPEFFKANDFNNAFYLKYSNVKFDNFGYADISFYYIHNELISGQVEMEIFKDSFSQIKPIRDLFENNITSNYKIYKKDIILDDINYTINELKNCIEKGKFDYSQDKSLYYKRWNFDNPIKSNSKLISSGIYLYSNGNICCRAKIVFNFSRLDLFKIQMETNIQSYVEIDEYKKKEIKIKETNGVFSLPVLLNNNLSLDFILDLGAADVSISQDVFSVLIKTGTISQADFLGEQSYQLANGTITNSKVFNLKSLIIGGFEINNVRASISNSINSPLLLGQSALKKFGKYEIDNKKLVLAIE